MKFTVINLKHPSKALLPIDIHFEGNTIEFRYVDSKKAKLFTITHFENELNDLKYYNDILEAIENHDNVCDINKSLFSLLVQFCDKMDFSKDRLEDNYREKFRYYCYEDINRIDFIFDEKNFGIDIITNDIPDFNDMFLSENFPKKVINAVNILALKLNKEPIIKTNGNILSVNY